MNALRESYFLNENQGNFNNIFTKVALYNQNRQRYTMTINESRFNYRYDIRFNSEEQNAIKEMFKLMEQKYFEGIPLNEAENDGKLKVVVDFFKKLSKAAVSTVSQFIKYLLEMFSKLGDKFKQFIDKVFGFDGFENVQAPKGSDEILNDIDGREKGFLNAVALYCQENMQNEELINAAKEMNQVNEGFDEWVDQKLKSSRTKLKDHAILRWAFAANANGGKMSIWKTIGVSILGSVILCTIVPLLCKIFIGAGVLTTCICFACKAIWICRGVLKVLYHRSLAKSDDQKIFNFWTILQIVLIVGTPIIFSIPAVKEAFNKFMMDMGSWVLEKLGIKESVKDWMESLGLGTTNPSTRTITEVKDPQAAQDELLKSIYGDKTPFGNMDASKLHKVGGNFSQMFFSNPSGTNVGAYNKDLVSHFGLFKNSPADLEKILNNFNAAHITDQSCYQILDNKLEGANYIMMYTDKLGNPKHGMEFIKKVMVVAKEKGLDFGNSKGEINWGNIINKEAYAASHGNRGAIELIGTTIPATKENINIMREATQQVIGAAHPGAPGPDGGVMGVINKVMDVTEETTQETVTTFTPELEFGALYMPMYNKKDAAGGTGGGAPTVKPAPNVPEKIDGMVLHDVKTNKDYPIAYIIKNVKMSAVADIMPIKDIQNMLDIESKTLEMKGDVKMTNESREERRAKRMRRMNALKDFDWSYLNESEEDDGSDDEVERKEKNLIAYISQGNFTITAFMSSDPQFNKKPLAIFCPFYSMVGINKQIAQEENVFPFKNLFSHYTIRCSKEKMSELRYLLNALMSDAVIKTYEVIKFTAQKWNLVEEKNRLLYPTKDSPQGEIDALGKLTVKEFCAVHNGTVEGYKLFGGPLNVNTPIAPILNRKNKLFHFQSDGQDNISNDYEGQSKDIEGAKPTFDMWRDPNNPNKSLSKHSGATFDEFKHTVDGEKPMDDNGNGKQFNNTFGKRTHPQTNTKNPEKKTWLQKLWNSMTGKGNSNESFDFDHKAGYHSLNESLIESLGYDNLEALNESTEGWKQFVNDVNTVGKVVFPIIKKILKVGGKAAYQTTKFIVHKTAENIKKIPENKRKDAAKNTFFMLLYLCYTFNGSEVIDLYNSDPTYVNTQVSIQNDSLVLNDNGVEKTFKIPTNKTNEASQPPSNIRMLKKGEKAPDWYEPSLEMKKAIAAFEGFIPRIYDSKNPSRKITKKDMANPNVDLTIGYGHKLTAADRKKFPVNYRISEENAFKLFEKDLKEHVQSVNNHLKQLPYYNKVIFPQGFIDGLVSVRFNSSKELAFGHPDWLPKEETSFWERMHRCSLDLENKTLSKKDLEYTLSRIKTLFKPSFKKIYPGLPVRRAAEYDIMRQPYGEMKAELYQKIIDSKNIRS